MFQVVVVFCPLWSVQNLLSGLGSRSEFVQV